MRNKFWIGIAGIVIIAAIPLFSHLDTLPIIAYDEARLATNALEMSEGRSHILVPTYEYVPDMWNTKPPFLIWLQALCIKCLGANELAVRLPSAIAALATCMLVYWFCARKLKKFWMGFLAVAILISSEGYVRIHGTRTGDYDSMLTLFTTAYSLFYFLYLQTKQRKYIFYTCAAFCLGFLTKGVAVVFFLPALLIYTLIFKSNYFIFKSRDFYSAMFLCCAIPVSYYMVREQLNPGYFQAVVNNELGGRFNSTLENHKEGTWYYVRLISEKGFKYWIVALIPGCIVGLLLKTNDTKRFIIFSTLLIAVLLTVITIAQTKLDWYDLPIYPFMSLITALFFHFIAECIYKQHDMPVMSRYVVVLLFIVVTYLYPLYNIFYKTTNPEIYPYLAESLNMGHLLKDGRENKINIGGLKVVSDWIEPNHQWYIKADLGKNRLSIAHESHLQEGDTVGAYKQKVIDYMKHHYALTFLKNYHGTSIYRVEGRMR